MSQIKCIVAISDTCSKTIDHVHVVPTDDCAVRSITDLQRINPDHELIIHAPDFVLVHLGTIDMSTGSIVPDVNVICSVNDIVKMPEPKNIFAPSVLDAE